MNDTGADTLGTYRFVTDAKRAAAMAMLDPLRPIRTFSLAETFFVGFPGWATRQYRQRLAVAGWDPGESFTGEVLEREPRGPNRMTSLEERVEFSYNMGSKVNGLAHAGIDHEYYGGRRLEDLVADHGVLELDTTTWGPPLLTRGLLIDLVANADPDRLETAADGALVRRPDRTVTWDEIERAMEHQRLPNPEPGDAILLHTGWNHHLRTNPKRFMRHSPGVWLEETRRLARWSPALVGTDSWCWGTSHADVVQGAYGRCHQELLVRFGIRFAEGWRFDDLVTAGVDRFVLVHNPVLAEGAVSTISPATAIANG